MADVSRVVKKIIHINISGKTAGILIKEDAIYIYFVNVSSN